MARRPTPKWPNDEPFCKITKEDTVKHNHIVSSSNRRTTIWDKVDRLEDYYYFGLKAEKKAVL